VFRLLGEFRGMPPVNVEALEAVLLRVSEMVCELPWIREMDINPLIADEHGAVAVDARIVVENLPPTLERYGHMAIHPYPTHLVSEYVLPDGTGVTIRPIRPEDAEMEQEFVKDLSAESKYFRFMNTLRELTQSALARFTQIDYDREMAFIAVTGQDGQETELGVCRYATNPDAESCEFALVVADAWQHRGIARRLMNTLIDAARAKGLKYMVGHVLASNERMLGFVTSLGFVVSPSADDPGVKRAVLNLQGAT
ncbi:MAG: GNAT family N-acetyltransferase, partial [Rhodocyclaceae bacterium]|nr:GNAT family N-acetyltransferase [Rhodocyclaceae bacterium]